MRVRLMLTCLCDAFYGEVGIASVRLLEYLGCEVEFIEAQTCCGQPPFNNGDWKTARDVGRRCMQLFGRDHPIVTPSSSCAAMLVHGYQTLFPDAPPLKAYELAEFVIAEFGLEKLRFHETLPVGVVYHQACHSRSLKGGDAARTLISSLPGVTCCELKDAEQCCGFGGAFSIGQGALSKRIGLEKLNAAAESGAELLVSGDMGCLMHLTGLIERHNIRLVPVHYASLVAERLA